MKTSQNVQLEFSFKHKYQEIMEQAASYLAEEKPLFNAPETVASFFRPLIKNDTQEKFYCVYLDTKNRMINYSLITVGLLDRANIHAREVFRQAIIENCAKIIIVHNHPSGDPTPSEQDIRCTKALIDSGKIIGIEVIDHIIVGKKTTERLRDYRSLREEGSI